MQLSKPFVSPHGDKTRIYVGLVKNKPFFIHSGSKKDLDKFATTSLFDNASTMADFRNKGPRIVINEFSLLGWGVIYKPLTEHGIDNEPITWVPINKYCWEDEIVLREVRAYRYDSIWNSTFLNHMVYVAVKDLQRMILDGVKKGGVYKGIFCFNVYGTSCFLYPTHYL